MNIRDGKCRETNCIDVNEDDRSNHVSRANYIDDVTADHITHSGQANCDNEDTTDSTNQPSRRNNVFDDVICEDVDD